MANVNTQLWHDITEKRDVMSEQIKGAGSSKLGKEEFVKLLLHQMTHQDPTQPMDSQQMIAQLSSFATLELMTNSNRTLDSLLLSQAASQQMQAISVVGKEIMFRTDKVSIDAPGGTATVVGQIGQPAENVTVVITDGNGVAVRTIESGARPSGLVEVLWDGKNDAGEAVAPGAYSVRVTAASGDGTSIPVDQQARGRAEGVTYKDGIPEIVFGNLRIKLSDVTEIRERSTQ